MRQTRQPSQPNARIGQNPVSKHLSSACIAAGLLLFVGCGPSQPQIDATLTECPACPQMSLVAPGSFEMGRDGGEPKRYDGPVRAVTIAQPFYLSTYEVTFEQFEAFVAATSHQPVSGCNVFIDGYWGWSETANWRSPGLSQPPKPRDPVVCVSWNDAAAYVDWIAAETAAPYRLPTEAQWEFAARDGTSGEFAWDGAAENGCDQANMFDTVGRQDFEAAPWDNASCSDGFSEVAPVGSLKPNSNGLYDMLGNVWEWTQDCYVLPYPDTAPTDGSSVEVDGDCARRTVRGGSWETRPSRLAPAFRGRDAPEAGFRTFGIRVARDAAT